MKADFNCKILILAGVSFIFIYFKFYPPFYSFADERVYIIQAESLSKGKLTVPEWTKGFAIHRGKTGIVPKYPPFHSLLFLLLPYKIGFKFIFLSPLLMHILGFLVFSRILILLNISPLWSLLYLFHPSFVFYSRTVMPDLATLFMFSLTLFLYLKRKTFSYFSNFFLSLLKPPNFLYSFTFAWVSFKNKKYKDFFLHMLALFTGGFLIFIYLVFIYGRKHPDIYFSFQNFFKNFKSYTIFLNLNYPLLLILGLIGILKLKEMRNFLFGMLPILSLYLLYIYHWEVKGNYLISSIVGLRFLLPFVLLLLIGYSFFLERLFKIIKINQKLFFISLFIIGSISLYVMMRRHFIYQYKFQREKDIIYENTSYRDFLLTHFEISKLLLPLWGERKNIHFTDWGRFTLFEHIRDIDELPDSFILVYTLKSGEKDLYYVKSYADSVLKIFSYHKLLFSDGHLYIYRVYNYNNYKPRFQERPRKGRLSNIELEVVLQKLRL